MYDPASLWSVLASLFLCQPAHPREWRVCFVHRLTKDVPGLLSASVLHKHRAFCCFCFERHSWVSLTNAKAFSEKPKQRSVGATASIKAHEEACLCFLFLLLFLVLSFLSASDDALLPGRRHPWQQPSVLWKRRSVLDLWGMAEPTSIQEGSFHAIHSRRLPIACPIPGQQQLIRTAGLLMVPPMNPWIACASQQQLLSTPWLHCRGQVLRCTLLPKECRLQRDPVFYRTLTSFQWTESCNPSGQGPASDCALKEACFWAGTSFCFRKPGPKVDMASKACPFAHLSLLHGH